MWHHKGERLTGLFVVVVFFFFGGGGCFFLVGGGGWLRLFNDTVYMEFQVCFTIAK